MSLDDAIDADVRCTGAGGECFELVRIYDWRDARYALCSDHEDDDQ